MTTEFPSLRLGLAGFSAAQQEQVRAVVQDAMAFGASWEVGPFTDADAWWINGQRTTLLPDGTLQVDAGTPSGRSFQLNLSDVDRPVAFARPFAPEFSPACAFDLSDTQGLHATLDRFAGWLRPVLAQFALASAIIDHYDTLGGGCFQMRHDGRLIACVDMHGDVGVLPTAGLMHFHDALWQRVSGGAASEIPEHFLRISLSQLMWQFAARTRRDVLPPRYRMARLYFRRAPRIPHRMLRDAHLLLMRELKAAPATLRELEKRTGLEQVQVVQGLTALYLVGAITSNPKRASTLGRRRDDSLLSHPPQGRMLSAYHEQALAALEDADGTVPVPLTGI